MPVKVKCPNCDKALSAPDAARGKAIKCPECQTRIAVPAEESSTKLSAKAAPPKTAAPKAAASKAKAKKPTKPVDSESALATFDMRRAEDTEARICHKCGYDMQYQDEEDTECPQCGYDSEAHGLGAKARKRAMKGPDPADFYPGLFKEAWKFVGRNYMLAFRTIGYTLISLLISMFCVFMYLWVSPWPPRIFLVFCFFISFLVIPGWMWFLDTEVIKLTLERKDKFKKLNFDFFLASAMGAAFVFWCVAVALPLMALPGGIGYALVNYSGMPDYVLTICLVIGAIPAIWMLPVVMSHMSMPVQYKGWQIWKVAPMWARNLKPLSVWFMWFLLTNVLNVAGVTTIAVVYGESLTAIVDTMEFNADNNRKRQAMIENPNAKRKGDKKIEIVKVEDPKDVDFFPVIVPSVILVVMSIANGFTCMFNMRTNGQFTYYHKSSLEMVDKLKEYKYVAKEKRGDDDDEKPKTTVQLLVDAFAFVAVFSMLGLVGGLLYGNLTSAGLPVGLFFGALIGQVLAYLVSWIVHTKFAFEDSGKWGTITLLGLYPIGFTAFVCQNFEERKAQFFQMLFAVVPLVGLLIAGMSVGMFSSSEAAVPPAAQPPMEANPMAAPGTAPPNTAPPGTQPAGPPMTPPANPPTP